MKKLKNIICLMLVLFILVFSLVGCSFLQSQNGEIAKEEPGKQQEEPGGEQEEPAKEPGGEQEESGKDPETPKYSIQLSKTYSGKTVELTESAIRTYINASSNETKLATLLYQQVTEKQSWLDHQKSITFMWKSTGKAETFTLHFAKDSEFKEELFTYETDNNAVTDLGIFVPGETYFYKVVGSVSGESKVDYFKAGDSVPVRYITAGAVRNVRDLGGWTTQDGKKVKYGMLYRGAALDGFETWIESYKGTVMEGRGTSRLDETGLKVFNEYLKIKGEIDLRGETESPAPGNQHETPTFGGEEKYLCQLPNVAATVLWKNPKDTTLKNAIQVYFSFLADINNYPIYFHCNGGADRTGALAFLINGLLGVDYEYLAIDYELTNFSSVIGTDCRSRSKIDNSGDSPYFKGPDDSGWVAVSHCAKNLKEIYKTDNLQEAIENYLLDCGVTEEEISNIKSIMLVDEN